MTTTTAADAPEILCEDLVRVFVTEGVEVQALQGLNLRVDAGELVAVVGASGSGKSTLLTILSGLDRPTAGTAVVAGTPLVTMDARQRRRYQRDVVGFVWQQTSRNLLPYLTAAENVAVPLVVAGARARAERAAELLDVMGVADCRDRLPAQMSGGQQQRVAIATAVAGSPRVLLADEPTGELDESTSADVLEAMRHVNATLGVTTLIVTHDPTVSEHVHRTVQIRDGRTSTEVLRRTERGEDGVERLHAEEFAVLDKVGRLQLPREVVERLDLRDRVRLGLEHDHVRVSRHDHVPAADAPPPSGDGADAAASGTAARTDEEGPR
ncbi:ABC transporter ATP-binding protein [Cellulomonas biazotea]|uniref:ABC transporter ATP-binding protein n=1 Tax=Cellulomonas biazotea TaxID=1709 RepID=A0A402DQW1_9CELL|nr:ABC transporter ATP-binding protein [Cellulomonas biazotea]GCE76529.1 ABC transporter ATP-binding protein [Cellulomonas biazotea]